MSWLQPFDGSPLAQLKAHRRQLVDPKIKQRHGRIVKTTGDGMLVEFASPVEAVRCALEVQRGMVARNADIPSDKRIVSGRRSLLWTTEWAS